MLTYLKNVNDGSVFYLVHKDQFIVGRKDCDFLISDDQSISRKHAIIRIKANKITVEDYGSKYKTLFNGNKLEPNVEKELNYNDEIQFGIINSKYRLERHKIVTAGTLLKSPEKVKLKSYLAIIGGQYVENWSAECTHLTVEKITLTIKVLHAIIDDKPIVRPGYWSKFAENVTKNLPPPNIDGYKPPIAETLLNNTEFKSDPKRNSLFKGKLFVFSKEKNKKNFEEIIKKAGGTSISWEKDPMPLDDIKSSPKEFIIIQPADNTDTTELNEVIKHFSKQGKRTIPLKELAVSIVTCSCEKDCNPNFNRVEEVFPVSQPNEPTQNNALVPGTQSQYFTVKKNKDEEDENHIIIPETIENELVKLEKEPVCEITQSSANDRQALKRSTNNELEGTALKRAKMDSANLPSKSTTKSNPIKQEVKDNFLSKSTLSQKRAAEPDKAVANINKNRKEDQLVSSNKNKKKKFDMDDKNHKPSSSGKNKRGNDDDLSELSVCKKKKDDCIKDRIFSSTRQSNHLDLSLNFSKLSKIHTLNNNLWYSKDTITNTTSDLKENIENTFDTEIQNFIDKFKDSVTIEVITQLPKRSAVFQDVVDGRKYSKQKHNFKRFLKVMSTRPQRIIIGKDNSVPIEPRDTTGIVDNRKNHFLDDEVDDDTLKKKAPKKFFI